MAGMARAGLPSAEAMRLVSLTLPRYQRVNVTHRYHCSHSTTLATVRVPQQTPLQRNTTLHAFCFACAAGVS